MAESTIQVTFHSDIKTVWDIVTALDSWEWRSDIRKISVIQPGKQFVEYTNKGYPTTFTITLFQPYGRYEMDMENTNMRGHWVGIFRESDAGTEIDFTEWVEAKKFLMKPFVKSYLKKQQQTYIRDLRKVLAENV